ncbi:MAG: hypothetical protein ACYCPS_03580 [Candidatus Saccharimonadales bacterium]
MNKEQPEYPRTTTDTFIGLGGFVLGAAITVPELTGLVPPHSLTGRLAEIGALTMLSQAMFVLERVARNGRK